MFYLPSLSIRLWLLFFLPPERTDKNITTTLTKRHSFLLSFLIGMKLIMPLNFSRPKSAKLLILLPIQFLSARIVHFLMRFVTIKQKISSKGNLTTEFVILKTVLNNLQHQIHCGIRNIKLPSDRTTFKKIAYPRNGSIYQHIRRTSGKKFNIPPVLGSSGVAFSNSNKPVPLRIS